MRLGGRRIAWRDWGVEFAAATAIGVFLGLIGPFGSFFNGPLWQRAGYWVAMAWLGYLSFWVCGRPLMAWLGAGRRGWAAFGACAVAMSVPLAMVSWLLARAIWPALQHARGLTPFVWYLQSLIITAPQVALFTALSALRPDRNDEGPAGGMPPPSPSLLGVAPREVICLQMEDHYVRVHAAAGSRLVLATLAQAMAALGDVAGLRVHRSWWVADRAVVGAVSEGRNVRLMLINGLEAPVARTSVAAVRAAGWLERVTDRERVTGLQ